MNYSQKDLQKMNKVELVDVATQELGVENAHMGLTKADLIDLILDAQEAAADEAGEILKADAGDKVGTDLAPAEEQKKPGSMLAELDKSKFVDINNKAEEERVRVIFHNTQLPGGDRPVEGSVNGRAFRYPREEPVEVPVVYLRALEDAVEEHFAQVKRVNQDGEVEYELKGRPVRRFPYSLVGEHGTSFIRG